jgi:hypothetical protein
MISIMSENDSYHIFFLTIINLTKKWVIETVIGLLFFALVIF